MLFAVLCYLANERLLLIYWVLWVLFESHRINSAQNSGALKSDPRSAFDRSHESTAEAGLSRARLSQDQ